MADETTGALNSISEQGQQVAQATGASYTDLGKTEIPEYADYEATDVSNKINTEAGLQDGLSYVDQDKSTVAGQLNTLLSQDSPYLQQARLAGEKQSAQRGMLNSSMGAGASEAAAIQAGLPIAQQDAQIYSEAQGRQQAADYGQAATKVEGIVSGGLSQQNAKIKAADQRLQNQFTAAMQGATESNKVFLQDMQNTHSTFLTQMEADHQLLLQRENTSAEKAAMISTQASTIMQNYQISVENMMTDPNFLDLGTAAVNKAIQSAQTLAKNTLKFVGSTADVDMDGIVDHYLTDITFR